MLYCMEPSTDKSLVFCGGTTGRNTPNGVSQGTLAAITFSKDLKLVSQLVLEKQNIQACTAMKRFKDRNDLAVGCFKHLLIVRFTGTKFDVLNIIENIHTSKPKTTQFVVNFSS